MHRWASYEVSWRTIHALMQHSHLSRMVSAEEEQHADRARMALLSWGWDGLKKLRSCIQTACLVAAPVACIWSSGHVVWGRHLSSPPSSWRASFQWSRRLNKCVTRETFPFGANWHWTICDRVVCNWQWSAECAWLWTLQCQMCRSALYPSTLTFKVCSVLTRSQANPVTYYVNLPSVPQPVRRSFTCLISPIVLVDPYGSQLTTGASKDYCCRTPNH